MKIQIKHPKGFTLLEVLIAILILIFIISGFVTGLTSLKQYTMATKLNARVKEIVEQLRDQVQAEPYENLVTCFNITRREVFSFNSTETLIPFDDYNFWSVSNSSANSACQARYPSTAYYGGSGYIINLSYNAGVVLDDLAGNEIGTVIGIIADYTEPKTKQRKVFRVLVFRIKPQL